MSRSWPLAWDENSHSLPRQGRDGLTPRASAGPRLPPGRKRPQGNGFYGLYERRTPEGSPWPGSCSNNCSETSDSPLAGCSLRVYNVRRKKRMFLKYRHLAGLKRLWIFSSSCRTILEFVTA